MFITEIDLIIKVLKKNFSERRLHHALLVSCRDTLYGRCVLNEIASIIMQMKVDILKSHTNIYLLGLENREIKILDIKFLLQKLTLCSYNNNPRIILILGPENLNIEASNALLKTLEEPPSKTYFLFHTSYIEKIIPTIVSRMQVVRLGNDTDNFNVKYLKNKYFMLDEKISTALRITRSSLSVIDRIKTDKNFWILRQNLIRVLDFKIPIISFTEEYKDKIEDVFYWFTSFIVDLYYLSLDLSSSIANFDHRETMSLIAERCKPTIIYEIYERFLLSSNSILEKKNINYRIILEVALLDILYN